MTETTSFWPKDARLAVSFSLMFEAGGQPISGAGGVIPDPIKGNLPDLPTNAFFQYGVYEGVPRILDLLERESAWEQLEARGARLEQLLAPPISKGRSSSDTEQSTECGDTQQRRVGLDAQSTPAAPFPDVEQGSFGRY